MEAQVGSLMVIASLTLKEKYMATLPQLTEVVTFLFIFKAI